MTDTFDWLITGAEVHDGISDGPSSVSVAIKGDRIAYVGEQPVAASARQSLDASGLLLCPGFIDTHASTGLGYMLPKAADNKLYQGVTTEIVGNCGTSSAPLGRKLIPTLERLSREIGFDLTWRELGEWMRQVEAYGLEFNVGTFAGHSTLRGGVCSDFQQVTDTEIQTMCGMLDKACREGALGLSTGLVYAPGSFATTEEIIELARVAARHRGIYVSHIRDERQDLEASIEETIRIGREARLPILVSHLKAGERQNWGKIPGVIRRIEAARDQGLDISFEVYPYAAVSTKLRTFIPKETLVGGVTGMIEKLRTEAWRVRSVQWLRERGTDFDAMVLISESVPGARGKSILEIARDADRDPAEMVVDLLLSAPETWIVYHCLSEEDVDAAVMWPESIICSDSWSHPVNAPNQFGNPHPRTFGAFTRFIERWALTGRITMSQAVKKITALPADMLGISERGRIAEGKFADLVLLDPDRVVEKATYADPRQFSEGTEKVWVNGRVVLSDGEIQRGKAPGQFLRRSTVAPA